MALVGSPLTPRVRFVRGSEGNVAQPPVKTLNKPVPIVARSGKCKHLKDRMVTGCHFKKYAPYAAVPCRLCMMILSTEMLSTPRMDLDDE